jgi:hypothetical protein
VGSVNVSYIVRPILPIIISHNNSKVYCGGLIDTGADFNLFPLEIANLLDIDLAHSPQTNMTGINTESPIPAYESLVNIGLGVRQCEVVMYFSPFRSISEYGLLGTLGFFNRFVLDEFDVGKRKFSISEKPNLLINGYIYFPFDSTGHLAIMKESS